MNEDRFRLFRAVSMALTAIGAVVVFLFSQTQYFEQQRHLEETRIKAEKVAREREVRRTLLLQKIERATAINRLAAEIGVAADSPDRLNTLAERFEVEYLSLSGVFDGDDLRYPMDALRRSLKNMAEGYDPFSGNWATIIKQQVIQLANEIGLLIGQATDAYIEG